MISWLWTLMVLASIGCGVIFGTTDALSGAAMEGAGSAIELAVTLAGPMCLWCGVGELMRRVRSAGAAFQAACSAAGTAVSRTSPACRRFFGPVCQCHRQPAWTG